MSDHDVAMMDAFMDSAHDCDPIAEVRRVQTELALEVRLRKRTQSYCLQLSQAYRHVRACIESGGRRGRPMDLIRKDDWDRILIFESGVKAALDELKQLEAAAPSTSERGDGR